MLGSQAQQVLANAFSGVVLFNGLVKELEVLTGVYRTIAAQAQLRPGRINQCALPKQIKCVLLFRREVDRITPNSQFTKGFQIRCGPVAIKIIAVRR